MIDSPKIKTACSSPKQYSGRMGYEVQFIVIHHTTTNSFASTRDWFCNHTRGGSAHYCIDRDGEIYRFVSLSDTAWHCGDRRRPWLYANQRSVGIELTQSDPSPFTEEQYTSLAHLILWLCGEFDIPPAIMNEPTARKSAEFIEGFRGICGHSAIAITDCPGQFFCWERLASEMEKLKAGEKFSKAIKKYDEFLSNIKKSIKGVFTRWIG